MLHLLARRWWALTLRSLFAVVFGLLSFFVPGITLIPSVFTPFWTGFLIVSAMRAPGHHWPLLVEGSDTSTVWKHRGSGDGMNAKEQEVNTGNPIRREERSQPEIIEEQAGLNRVADQWMVYLVH